MFLTNASMSLSLNHACKVGCKFVVATVKTSLSGTIHLKREILM